MNNNSRKTNGALVISLDFEMMWGCHEWSEVDGYGNTNVRNVRKVIYNLLTLFEEFNIHATFATVGMIMCEDKNDLLLNIPDNLPSYYNDVISPYKEGFIDSINSKDTELFFGRDIIENLRANDNIEIGTHTFSHYYCSEPTQTLAQFESDIKTAIDKAKECGVNLESIVFPKNQVKSEYLPMLAKHGIRVYRGNATKFFGEGNRLINLKNRIARLLDSYFPLANNRYPIEKIVSQEILTNIPASRFLRPYNKKLKILDSLRIKRIKREIFLAAKRGEMYHLWWHPHNFGTNIDENLKGLKEIFEFFNDCRLKYGMKSYTMTEMANYLHSIN